MRSKEEAHDYRYFPDPDLLPLELDRGLRGGAARQLPELPDAKKGGCVRDYGLSAYDADVLVAERDTADFFEQVARGRDAKPAANWVINELSGRLNKEGPTSRTSPVSAAQLGAILDLIADGTISGKIAKDVFEIVWSEGGDPRAIVETARHGAGDRHRAPSRRRRRDHRREPRQGRAGEGEAGDSAGSSARP